MPEIAEVHVMKDRLKEKLANSTLIQISVDEKSKFHHTKNGLTGYTSHLFPATLKDIICHGKHLFFVLSTINTSHLYYIESTMGMTGRWLYNQDKHSFLSLTFKLDTTHNNTNINIYYDDMIKFGNIYIWSPEQYQNKISTLGIDILNNEISLNQFTEIIKNPKLKNKQICQFLLDQKYLAGIGNYLKAEILYHAKLKPDRLLSTLSETDINLLLDGIINITKDAYLHNGLTIENYLDPTGKLGVFDTKVYAKNVDPLQNKIQTDLFKDKRKTHWVPNVQI